MGYIRTPSGNGTYDEVSIQYRPSYDVDTYCGTVTEPVASYDLAFYEILGGGETFNIADITDEDFFVAGNFLPNSTSTVNYVSTVSQDIYYVGALCRYENEPTYYEFIKDGDYYIYADDAEINYSNPLYTRLFSLEPQEEESGGIVLISESSGTDLMASVGANTQISSESLFPIVAIVIGVILATSLGVWIVSLFEKSFQRTMDRAEKASREARDLLNR